jgi:hypothetical protein|tara:strand:+ start:219 stop:587 length:369 start_codon:yes stop_codon:yes gene_type:complete
MSSLAAALPLEIDYSTGFKMITDLKTLVKQNLKMLLLTNPGERVMEPRFGVGIKTYLFENFGSQTSANIDNKIREQVRIYMPAVQIQEITFGITDPDNNHLGIQLRYTIPGVGASDFLEITN